MVQRGENFHPETVSYSSASARLSTGDSRIAEVRANPDSVALKIAAALNSVDAMTLLGQSDVKGSPGAVLFERHMAAISRRPGLPMIMPDTVVGAFASNRLFRSPIINALALLYGNEVAQRVCAKGSELSLWQTVAALRTEKVLLSAPYQPFQPFGMFHHLSMPHTFVLIEDIYQPVDPASVFAPIAGKKRAQISLIETSKGMSGSIHVLEDAELLARSVRLSESDSVHMHLCTVHSNVYSSVAS